MKVRKATGPYSIAVEVWENKQWKATAQLAGLFNKITEKGEVPNNWDHTM